MAFLMKHVAQIAVGQGTEPISFANLFRASILKNTDALEKTRDGKHLGFNHLKLTDVLRRRFNVQNQFGTLSSYFYLVSRAS